MPVSQLGQNVILKNLAIQFHHNPVHDWLRTFTTLALRIVLLKMMELRTH